MTKSTGTGVYANAHHIQSNGVITISPESWDVYYSYGNSPAMEYVSSAGIVNLKGVLGIFSNVYNFSYGNRRS